MQYKRYSSGFFYCDQFENPEKRAEKLPSNLDASIHKRFSTHAYLKPC